ncbi:MAG: GNAT family N-acetyltransferase [Chloroflexi bacterium]|nr:GNAT family N-acetyltransferase [Chloroflexota bacterium]
MTPEERLAMMRVPEYEAELDLVVVAPASGRLAAYCLCGMSQEENERTGRREGTLIPWRRIPDFQRRGLARALLLTGLRVTRTRIDTAVLGKGSDNEAMPRTAQSVGFRGTDHNVLVFPASYLLETCRCLGARPSYA